MPRTAPLRTDLPRTAPPRADRPRGPNSTRRGTGRLARLVAEVRPRVLAVAGVTAYRTAFGRPRAAVGPQEERVGGTAVWVLPNPSGLNAHWTLDRIAGEMRRLKESLG
ncbi:uracil-DNA glycosylase family protein [Planomonospora parontospora]|uniref:uracil-DNA glycosylase family protein n=1 Tax=Planomonospora parontospora TaxID=58119 RepID=UPI003570F41A